MGKSSALNTSNERVKYTIEIIQNSQSIANNTSNVTVKVRFYRTNTGYETYGTGTVYCKINGTQYSASVTSSQKITNSGIDLFTKTLNISHGADGKKTLTCSAWISLNTPLTSSEQSYSQVLTTIQRYLSITQFEITNITETSMVVKWATSDPRNSTYYSFDNGVTWIGSATYGESLANDGKSGMFNIQKLTANTGYKIKIKIKRTDSGLWTESGEKSFSTYAYPYIQSVSNSNLTIGDKVYISVYNPLKRYLTAYIKQGSTSGKLLGNISGFTYGTSTYEIPTDTSAMYGSIPNSTSGDCVYYLVCTDISYTSPTVKGKYKIKGTETPTINGITYKDTSSVAGITQNNQLIVQNQSNLVITFEKATPNYSAGTISKYKFELNGVTRESASAGGTVDFGKVNSSKDVQMTVTVTDSRGISASRKFPIKMIAHSQPTANVTLKRLNNYEDETYLTVDASISSVNGKNTMAIQYRYKISGGSNYGSFSDIGNKETLIKEFDKNSSYIFNVVVTDIFGAKFDKEYVLDKGKFPLFIDIEKNAIGINDFPAENEALRVKEGVAHFIDGVKIAGNPLADYIVEQGTGGIWNYRKWSSGIAECWCKYHSYDVNCSQKNYSGFYYSEEIAVDLPIDFKTISQFTTSGGSSDNLNFARPSWCDISADKVYFLMMCLVPTMTNATINVYISVKGTWK